MSTATITSKGQMTIPKEVRDALRLRPGDRVDLVVEASGGGARLVPLTGDVRTLKGYGPRPRRKASVEDINRAVRARASRSA